MKYAILFLEKINFCFERKRTMRIGRIQNDYTEKGFGLVKEQGLSFAELCMNSQAESEALVSSRESILAAAKATGIDVSSVGRWNHDVAENGVINAEKAKSYYELLDAAKYDYVVDCIDTLSPKVNLIAAALERGLPVVSSMGAGAKTDPTKMEICDISRTHHCPLAHMLRKRLHKIGIRKGFHAVFSPEPVREGAMILCEEQNKKSNTGTISYIPALFGIGCASVVVRSLIGEF